jgi:methionyl-tRNA formyltransferase
MNEGMRIVVLSTRSLGEKIVEGLIKANEEVVGVCGSPVPAGVSDRMEKVAAKLGLPFLKIKKATAEAPEFFEQYAAMKPELNLMGGLRAFLPETVLHYPRYGTVGWHPSLLPRYAGANSLCWPIMFGESKTANTVYWADRGIDSGPILLQKEIEISPDDTFATLYHQKVLPGAVEAILEAVRLIRNGTAPRVPQDLSQYSYYSFITPGDALIDWMRPGRQVYNQIRGTNPNPGASSNFGDSVVGVFDSEYQPGFRPEDLEKATAGSLKAGTVIDITGRGIRVAVPDGSVLIKVASLKGVKMPASRAAEQLALKIGDKLGRR